MRLSTTVAGHRLQLTMHSVDRYCERIKCINDPSHAERVRFSHELCYLLRNHGHFQSAEPDWIGITPEDATAVRRADFYVTVGDDICVPVEQGSTELVGVTLLARGGLSEKHRRRRNERKQYKRARAADRRASEAWIGERAQRWQ